LKRAAWKASIKHHPALCSAQIITKSVGSWLKGKKRVLHILVNDAHEVDGLTHQDIAECLGIYRETVTNALNELKAASLISIGRKHVTILDRGQLERAARQ